MSLSLLGREHLAANWDHQVCTAARVLSLIPDDSTCTILEAGGFTISAAYNIDAYPDCSFSAIISASNTLCVYWIVRATVDVSEWQLGEYHLGVCFC